MSIRPNAIGPKSFFFEPGLSTFTSAEIAAIDQSHNPSSLPFPYAYTATVRDDYDSRNFSTDSGASTQNLLAAQQFAFGLFLSPNYDLRNLLFQLSAHVHVASLGGDDAHPIRVIPFFGRTAAATVTSSKAAQSNLLSSWIQLPVQAIARHGDNAAGTIIANIVEVSVYQELFALRASTPTLGTYPWCFGVLIQNTSGAEHSMSFHASLAFRKYGTSDLPFYDSRLS